MVVLLLKENTRPVKVKKIVHVPGSGASTIAMSAFLQLYRTHRCCSIDGKTLKGAFNMEEEINLLADLVIRFRSLGEESKEVSSKAVILYHFA